MDSMAGISLPSFLVSAACNKVETAEPAMIAAGYSDDDQVLVQCIAVTLVASAGGARRLNSQAAPSGASRSFKNIDDALTLMRRSLKTLDPAGTVSEIVGPDPATSTLMMVVC